MWRPVKEGWRPIIKRVKNITSERKIGLNLSNIGIIINKTAEKIEEIKKDPNIRVERPINKSRNAWSVPNLWRSE